MKSLNNYILEKLFINKKFKRPFASEKTEFPKSFKDLYKIITRRFNTPHKRVFDLSDIDTSKVDVFNNCKPKRIMQSIFDEVSISIPKKINVTNWDTSQIKDMNNLFSGFCYLKEIIGLETWDVSNVTDMSEMFAGCGNLKSINIEDWNVSEDCNITDMFKDCIHEEIIPQWYKDRIK